MIRVGGRLDNSLNTIDRNFPVLTPRKSPITEMLIREAHDKKLHGGPQLTLYAFRQTVRYLEVFCSERCLIHLQAMYPFWCQIVTASDGRSTSRTFMAVVICVQSMRTRLLWTILHKKWNSNAFENIRCSFHLLQYNGGSDRASYVSDQGQLSFSH